MRRLTASFVLALPLFASSCPAPAHATPFDTNLIVNGAAEACTPGPTGYEIVPIPGWSRTGDLTAVAWTTAGGFPTGASPGPAERGNAFFAGGPNLAASEISQAIDISDLAAAIDGGTVGFRLAGYVGGYANQEDNARLRVMFRDAPASPLDSATIGPVTIADRGGVSGLLLCTQEGSVPVGTRSLQFRLICNRLAGSYDDGYADSLTFVLKSSTVGVGDRPSPALEFSPVFPNPVRDGARFAFRLPAAADVRLDVLDVHGRRVAVVAEGRFPAGAHAPAWRRSGAVAPGVYFARLQAGSQVMRRRFVVLD